MALCGFVALEFLMERPAVWVSSLLRLKGAPGMAIQVLGTTYLHMLLPPLVAFGVLGLVHHYADRLRKAGPATDFAAAGSAFAYAYVPHVLLVGLGVLLAAGGFDSPWLPQYGVVALDANWQRWIKLLVVFAPSAALVAVAWQALRRPQDAGTWLPQSASAVLSAGPIALGIGATLFTVFTHWAEFKPSTPGDPVPAFSIQGIQRPNATESLIAGHPAVIDFWATWCPPCIASLPHLQRLYHEFAARGVVFAAVNIEPDNRAGVEGFIAAQKLDLPFYIDADGRMQERFHVHVYPTTWLVDAAGRIVHIYSGPFAPDDLRQRLEVLAP